MTEECICGFEAKDSRGLSAHQRYCDEYQEAEMVPSDDDPHTVPTRGDEKEYSDFEEEVLSRDSYECRRCGEDASCVHKMKPEGDEKLSNFRAVCGDCDAFLEGLHPQTKDTEVKRGP